MTQAFLSWPKEFNKFLFSKSEAYLHPMLSQINNFYLL